jgi:hypothetical protein
MNERTFCFGVDVHRDQLVLRAADKATGQELGSLLRAPNNRLGAEQVIAWLLHLAVGADGVSYSHLEGQGCSVLGDAPPGRERPGYETAPGEPGL